MQRIRRILEGSLLVWLVLSSGAMLLLTVRSPEIANFVAWSGKHTLKPAIVIAMFSIGFLLPISQLLEVGRKWNSVLAGSVTQYASMPLLAWLVAEWFGFSGAIRNGMIVVGCVPGAMASNVLTLTSKGNVSYSIAVTTLSTLCSPIAVPLLLRFFLGVEQGPDPVKVFMDLFLTVAAPVIVGLLSQILLRKFGMGLSNLEELAAIIANFAILWVIAIAIGLNAERLSGATLSILGALLVINLSGYLVGYLASKLFRLEVGKRKALVLEIGMQNAGVGTMLALSVFQDPAVAIPTAAYTFGCMFTGTVLANFWNWRSSGDAKSSLDAPN